MVKDPICGMMVNEKTAKLKSEYQGQTFYFCNTTCKTTFDKNPAKYAKGGSTGAHACGCGCGGH